jgi:pimeloyl-ACP methyl ester carboxylesterase
LVPGSCSTGAAWRPVLDHLRGVRSVTTGLSGYGGTAERRTGSDHSITPVAEALEEVIDRAGDNVHLVGHSFGGLTALAVALRGRVPLLSLTILEAPPEASSLAQFRTMTDAYMAAHESGKVGAIGAMIDFYAGPGSWATMPERVRAYAMATTAVNLLDWEGAYGFVLDATLAGLRDLRVCIAVGAHSHPAVIRANALVAERITVASFETIASAAHFMIATHPEQVAALIKRQIG